MSALSTLLIANLPKGWTRRQVAREARKLGLKMSDATATAYFRGEHGSPDEDTLAVFATTLKVPLPKLRVAAGLPPEPGQPWVPPRESSWLHPDQRRALNALVKVMAHDAKQVMGNAQHPAPKNDDPDGMADVPTVVAPIRPGTPGSADSPEPKRPRQGRAPK